MFCLINWTALYFLLRIDKTVSLFVIFEVMMSIYLLFYFIQHRFIAQDTVAYVSVQNKSRQNKLEPLFRERKLSENNIVFTG